MRLQSETIDIFDLGGKILLLFLLIVVPLFALTILSWVGRDACSCFIIGLDLPSF
jgi:hypothetical protein